MGELNQRRDRKEPKKIRRLIDKTREETII